MKTENTLLPSLFKEFVPLYASVFALLVGFIFVLKSEDEKNNNLVRDAYKTWFSEVSLSNSTCSNNKIANSAQIKLYKNYKIKTWTLRQSNSDTDLTKQWDLMSIRSPSLDKMFQDVNKNVYKTDREWEELICAVSFSEPFSFGIRAIEDNNKLIYINAVQPIIQSKASNRQILLWAKAVRNVSEELEIYSVKTNTSPVLESFILSVESYADTVKRIEVVLDYDENFSRERLMRIVWPGFFLGIVGVFGVFLPTANSLFALYKAQPVQKKSTLHNFLLYGWLPLASLLIATIVMLFL